MHLDINGEKRLENPAERITALALKSLQPEMFAILVRGNERYLQTFYNDDGTFELEYRDGSFERHFRATNEPLTIDDILRAFAGFQAGRADWQAAWTWEPVEFPPDFFGGELSADDS